MALKSTGTIHDDMFVSNAPSKADRRRDHRKIKHAIINERIAFLRSKIKMTAAQRASEARMYADKVLSEQRKAAEILSA